MINSIPGYRCPNDDRSSAAADLEWRCPDCGSPWDLDFTAGRIDQDQLSHRGPSMWRYTEALPLTGPTVSLGEGRTPLIGLTDRVSAKLDYLMPTLSFKDRGAAMLLEAASRLQPDRVIADSSGNAGTAVAAYAARAGLPCRIFVPGTTSAKKVEQIRAHGAEVVQVDGSREDTARAAQHEADQSGTFYASHVYNPYFLHGTKTYGYELWEDRGGRLPEVIVLPVGNGTLVLGVALALAELVDHGLIAKKPRLVAVQAAAVSPLARAHRQGLAEVPAGYAVAADTVAEGIAIAEPARSAQILQAIDDSGGDIVTVSDAQVGAAQRDLARRGLYVESTAGACWAAVQAAQRWGSDVQPDTDQSDEDHEDDRIGRDQLGWQLLAGSEIVLPLCGAGLKTGLSDHRSA